MISTDDALRPITFLSARHWKLDALSHWGVLLNAILNDANLRHDDGYLCVLQHDEVQRRTVREEALREIAQLLLPRLLQYYDHNSMFLVKEVSLIPANELVAKIESREVEGGRRQNCFVITRTWRPEGFTPMERLQCSYVIELVGLPT